MTETYYVYVLQNPKKPLRFNTDKYGLKYEPFYVGKGKGNRAEIHFENFMAYSTSHNVKLLSELTKLRSYGVQPVISKIFFSDKEEEAYRVEQEAIIHYGIRYKDGILVNAAPGKAGGWGGELNPTFDRMDIGSHNFQISNPQIDTPKINKLKKLILGVTKSSNLKTSQWLVKSGYSNIKSLKIGIERIITRDKLNYKIVGDTLLKI